MHVPELSGIVVPRELFWAVDEPALLAGMRYPRRSFPWNELAGAGIRHVVSLHPGDFSCRPLSIAFAERLDDLVFGGPPEDEARELILVRRAADVTLAKLRAGEGVVVHCVGGRGRTGTVIGCVLRELGWEPGEVVRYLDETNRSRGNPGWPESAWQARVVKQWSAPI